MSMTRIDSGRNSRKPLKRIYQARNKEGINRAFAKASREYNLKIRKRPGSTDYVGSAVHHIGIPLSLWAGFLEICEWALSQDNWSALSDEEWSEVATKRSGGRKRLSDFLLDNRETASDIIQRDTYGPEKVD